VSRYVVLAAVVLAGNHAVLTLLTGLGPALLPAKLLTEAGLVLLSYLGQRQVVFAAGTRTTPPGEQPRAVVVG
jgi:hypothetical protein